MADVKGICAGLVGPKSENVEIPLVFKGFFEASRRPRVRQPREQRSEPGDFWVSLIRLLDHLVQLCGQFGFGDHYGIIVESLWVSESTFSKNIHFPNRF